MELIYTLFENYEIWVLLFVVFIAQLGVPVGSTFFLMWYGSTIDTASSLLIFIPITALAASLGDYAAFNIGNRFSSQLYKAENKYSWLEVKMKQSEKLINTYGALIIWSTRFLITGLGPMVSYVLGNRRYPTLNYLKWVVFGELIFTAEMLYFGYYFKETWEYLLDVIADMGWLVALVFILLWIIKKLLTHKNNLTS